MSLLTSSPPGLRDGQHFQCSPLAEISPAKQAKTELDSYSSCFARRGLFFARCGLSVFLSAATVSTCKGESVGEPVGRCSDGKQAAGCDGSYEKRATGCDGSNVEQMYRLRSCYVCSKQQRRFFVLFADCYLYSKFVS